MNVTWQINIYSPTLHHNNTAKCTKSLNEVTHRTRYTYIHDEDEHDNHGW